MADTICLITTPSIFLSDARVFMSLGILKVGAMLKSAGYSVEHVDLSGIKNFEEVTQIHARQSKAKHFGITATTPQIPAAAKIAAAIKAVRPDARIILGGPHVTLVNAGYKMTKSKQLPSHPRLRKQMEILLNSFDVLVAGDGEYAIFEAIKDSPPRVIDADNLKSELFLTNEKLTQLPWPARELVDVKSYHYTIDGVRAMSLIAQLGCPFGCGFCGGRNSPFLRKVRMRATENVVNEMNHLYRMHGIRGFMMYDDELNVNPEMINLMKAIRKRQEELGVEWRLRGFIKSQLFTDEQAAAMYAAGFRWILVGFESGSPRILSNIKKMASRDDDTRCMEIAARHGLKVKALMSVGHPGESEETIMDLHRWLLSVQPADFDATLITTYPGTPYYDESPLFSQNGKDVYVYAAPKTGDRLYSEDVDYTQVAEYYKGNPDDGYSAYVWTDYLKREELVQFRDFVERDIRAKLGIPFNPTAAAIQYEHSMGQFPLNILRRSEPTQKAPV